MEDFRFSLTTTDPAILGASLRLLLEAVEQYRSAQLARAATEILDRRSRIVLELIPGLPSTAIDQFWGGSFNTRLLELFGHRSDLVSSRAAQLLREHPEGWQMIVTRLLGPVDPEIDGEPNSLAKVVVDAALGTRLPTLSEPGRVWRYLLLTGEDAFGARTVRELREKLRREAPIEHEEPAETPPAQAE